MNQEEKKAIKSMKEFAYTIHGTLSIKEAQTVLNLLEKKDKQIDEMAKKINEAYFESGDFEEWFENKICKVQKYEDYTYLEKDIKQHFEYKVEEDR